MKNKKHQPKKGKHNSKKQNAPLALCRDSQEILRKLPYNLSFEPFHSLYPEIESEIEVCTKNIEEKPLWVVDKLLKLKENHDIPVLYNLLCIAYKNAGDEEQFCYWVDELYRFFPSSIFAITNIGHRYLETDRLDKIDTLLGTRWDLQQLYPQKDVFHFSEVASFYSLLAEYYIKKGNLQLAGDCCDILMVVIPESKRLKDLETLLGDHIEKQNRISKLEKKMEKFREKFTRLNEDEKLRSGIKEGYKNIKKNPVAACSIWLYTWNYLVKSYGNNVQSIECLEKNLNQNRELLQWCQDLEMQLLEVAVIESEFLQKRLAYSKQFTTFFPDSDPETVRIMKQAQAETLCYMNQREEGEKLFQIITEEYPFDPWGFVAWGDVYRFTFDDSKEANYEKVKYFYEKALNVSGEYKEEILSLLDDLGDEIEHGDN